jgi:hypothetical protein
MLLQWLHVYSLRLALEGVQGRTLQCLHNLIPVDISIG